MVGASEVPKAARHSSPGFLSRNTSSPPERSLPDSLGVDPTFAYGRQGTCRLLPPPKNQRGRPLSRTRSAPNRFPGQARGGRRRHSQVPPSTAGKLGSVRLLHKDCCSMCSGLRPRFAFARRPVAPRLGLRSISATIHPGPPSPRGVRLLYFPRRAYDGTDRARVIPISRPYQRPDLHSSGALRSDPQRLSYPPMLVC